MSSVVISGDSSGAITLAAPSVAGTNTITLPASTGTVLTTGSPQSGGVIQVVSSVIQNNSSYFSTASTSFVSTGFSITITPKFSTSKIVLLNNATVDSPNTNLTAGLTIYRNGTNLATGTAPSCLGTLRCSSGYADVTTTMQFVDSPATTSALTYTVYAYASSATMYYGISGGNSSSNVISFIAMEIAA